MATGTRVRGWNGGHNVLGAGKPPAGSSATGTGIGKWEIEGGGADRNTAVFPVSQIKGRRWPGAGRDASGLRAIDESREGHPGGGWGFSRRGSLRPKEEERKRGRVRVERPPFCGAVHRNLLGLSQVCSPRGLRGTSCSRHGRLGSIGGDGASCSWYQTLPWWKFGGRGTQRHRAHLQPLKPAHQPTAAPCIAPARPPPPLEQFS